MKVIDKYFTYARPDEFHIYPIGDIHLGTKHCAESMLKKKIDEIKNDPFAYYVDMGDACEFITPSDKRWDAGGISDWVHPDNIATDEVNRYCELMSPIKGKCLGKIEGNHEMSIKLHNHDNVQKNICDKLGIIDLTYACWIRLHFERGTTKKLYNTVWTHGAGGAITPGAKMTRLNRLMDSFDASIVAQGHCHDIIVHVKPYLGLNDEGKIKHRVRVGAMTGCWFTGYTQDIPSSYSEQKNYPPVSIGCPVFTIKPDSDYIGVRGS